MLKKQRQSNDKGFTIIEVMIVLAIAALILLIVFLAIPAIQRNARNTGRRNDAGRIVAAVGDFNANHPGSLPKSTSDCVSVQDEADSTKFAQYSDLTCDSGTGPLPSTGKELYIFLIINTQLTSLSGPNETSNMVIFIPNTICSGNTAVTAGASAKNSTILYDIETPGNSYWSWVCTPAS